MRQLACSAVVGSNPNCTQLTCGVGCDCQESKGHGSVLEGHRDAARARLQQEGMPSRDSIACLLKRLHPATVLEHRCCS